jgi:hypothetical protein
VIANSGLRVPFIIDPASATQAWLRSHLAKDPSRPLEVVNSQDGRFNNQVLFAGCLCMRHRVSTVTAANDIQV